MRFQLVRCLSGACTLVCLGLLAQAALAQNFRYESEPRAGSAGFSYADADPAPLMDWNGLPAARRMPARSQGINREGRPLGERLANRARYDQLARETRVDSSGRFLRPAIATEPIPPGQPLDPFGEELPPPDDPVTSEGGSYDAYYDPGQTLEPQVMDESFMQGPGGPYVEEGYYSGGDCYAGVGCYLRQWWRHTNFLGRNGAYSENFSLFAGKQGFKGPVDQGLNGDFGYHGGGNWGMPLLDARGIGYQVGVNYIGSDFAGRTGPLGHRRAQFFVTTGAFRRAVYGHGWQGGAVLDYLRDDFYIQMDLTQVRAELSYLYNYHEIGFWGAFLGNTSTHWGQIPGQPWQTFSFESNSQYNIFYRYEFSNGTFCRTWGGLSAHGDGIFGGDTTVRVTERTGLIANYNYLLPRNDDTVPNNVKESWNLTISFVWYPGYTRRDSWKNPYRPLFQTADNGWFLTRQAGAN